MSATSSHRGGCHCGKVRFTVELDLSEPVIACNCSMCGRAGTLLSFANADRFQLESGQDALTLYQFNKCVIDHLFCSHCGIKSFARGRQADGSPMAAINVRCLDGVDLDALKVHHFDGKSQ